MPKKSAHGKVIVESVDISHSRLVDLAALADKAKPFYVWVEGVFQKQGSSSLSLEDILRTSTKDQIVSGLFACYNAGEDQSLPILFDGVGRSYPHQKACYYFFSWMVRDAPQQRLRPLISRMRKISQKSNAELQVYSIAELIYRYRVNLKTFSWDAIREVIIDRLEGSRRSIKGHENEAVVRTALLTAIQDYFLARSGYGIYASVELERRQVKLGQETFDVSARLFDFQGQRQRRILVPVKTRETEGGGHAHLFTRDITSAIAAVRLNSPEDFVIAVIVARNWSSREKGVVRERVDHAILLDQSPNDFQELSEVEQNKLNIFVAKVLSGSIEPKSGVE